MPLDRTQHCYGLAFVLPAYSHTYDIGVEEALTHIDATFAHMEKLFCSEQHGLYADEATPEGVARPIAARSQHAQLRSAAGSV